MIIPHRSELLNLIARANCYRTYLEIGVRNPQSTYDRICCCNKTGVDPAPQMPCTHVMTSDEFFENVQSQLDVRYDLVFIDGLHEAHQVYRDTINALANLSCDGTIVLHDCNPTESDHQTTIRKPDQKHWTGDTWKAFALLRMTRPDLDMFTVNTDWGLGVIRYGKQNVFPISNSIDEMDYELLSEHRVELMNLIECNTITQKQLRAPRCKFPEILTRRLLNTANIFTSTLLRVRRRVFRK